MKHYIVALAGFLSVGAGALSAQDISDRISGDLTFGAHFIECNDENCTNNSDPFTSYDVAGRLDVPLTGAFGLQLDFEINQASTPFSFISESYAMHGATAHAYWAPNARTKIGAYASWSDGDPEFPGANVPASQQSIGLEAMFQPTEALTLELAAGSTEAGFVEYDDLFASASYDWSESFRSFVSFQSSVNSAGFNDPTVSRRTLGIEWNTSAIGSARAMTFGLSVTDADGHRGDCGDAQVASLYVRLPFGAGTTPLFSTRQSATTQYTHTGQATYYCI